MKKAFLIMLAAIFIVSEAGAAFAAETPQFRKFRRGFCNLFTFHMEVGHQMTEEGKQGGPTQAATMGLAKGLGAAGLRALAGVYEVLTFPFPFPPKYEPMLKDPEFFWTEPFSEPEPVNPEPAPTS
jgi:putative exosortase-associated protein (TIGR04073 family)